MAGTTIAVTFVLLALVFHSIVIPIKAILLNNLSILAAYGLLVVVFQQGVGARLFDFRPVGTTQVYLPLLTFAVLFGISMDYEIFLLRRIKEEWERTGDTTTAVSSACSARPESSPPRRRSWWPSSSPSPSPV